MITRIQNIGTNNYNVKSVNNVEYAKMPKLGYDSVSFSGSAPQKELKMFYKYASKILKNIDKQAKKNPKLLNKPDSVTFARTPESLSISKYYPNGKVLIVSRGEKSINVSLNFPGYNEYIDYAFHKNGKIIEYHGTVTDVVRAEEQIKVKNYISEVLDEVRL